MNIYLTEIASAAAIAQENMQREHVPGLAMAFIKNGELVMSQCLGIADTERGIPVSNETYFEAASLTKPFFGRLVFELADEGVIALHGCALCMRNGKGCYEPRKRSAQLGQAADGALF